MSYTAPNDLFTSEEAILSLASSIADEDRTNLGNGTINGALDVLADALADQNVEVPPMNAGAILALAQYVTGGGGIQFETVLDEDVTFTYEAGGDSTTSYGYYSDSDSEIQTSHGDVLVMSIAGFDVVGMGSNFGYGSNAQEAEISEETYDIRFSGNTADGLFIEIGSRSNGPDATLQEWCQTPHRVTIKKCNVLA